MAKTIEQLKAQGAEIKNATVVGENTATRVGALFNDIVDALAEEKAAIIGTERIADKAVTLSKLSDEIVNSSKAKNLFNPNDPNVKVGYYLNQDGDLIANNSYIVSGYIPFSEKDGKLVCSIDGTANGGGGYSELYDSQKNRIAGFISSSTNGILKWQTGVAYARFSIGTGAIGRNIQIEKGEKITAYEPYFGSEFCFQESLIPTLTTDKLADGAVTSSKIAEDAVTSVNIADEAIGLAQISSEIIEKSGGKNRFNPNDTDVKIGYYINNDGILLANSNYIVTGYIPFSEEDGSLISSYNNGGVNNGGGFSELYDSQKNRIAGFINRSTNGILKWQEGVVYARFSIQTGDVNNNIQVEKGETITAYEPYTAGSYIRESLIPALNDLNPIKSLTGKEAETATKASLTDTGKIELTNFPWHIKKGLIMSMYAKVTSFSALLVGKGYMKYRGDYLRINATEIVQIRYESSEIVKETVTHGLNIQSFVKVSLTSDNSGQMYVVLQSKGGKFEYAFKNWAFEANYAPFALSEGSTLTDIELSAGCQDFRLPVWAFGDSYFGVDASRWIGVMKDFGYFNFLVNGLAGQSSAGAYADLERCLKFGTPKFLLWCLGMNDTDANFKTYFEKVRSICKSNDITLIAATVPTVPTRNKEIITRYVKDSGLRYIDFYKAVGTSSSGTWYNGYLNADGVHPNAIGAQALATQVLVDFPELMQYGKTVELVINSTVNEEAQTRAKADEQLNTAIVAEKNRAEAAEQANAQAIEAEIARAEAAGEETNIKLTNIKTDLATLETSAANIRLTEEPYFTVCDPDGNIAVLVSEAGFDTSLVSEHLITLLKNVEGLGSKKLSELYRVDDGYIERTYWRMNNGIGSSPYLRINLYGDLVHRCSKKIPVKMGDKVHVSYYGSGTAAGWCLCDENNAIYLMDETLTKGEVDLDIAKDGYLYVNDMRGNGGRYARITYTSPESAELTRSTWRSLKKLGNKEEQKGLHIRPFPYGKRDAKILFLGNSYTDDSTAYLMEFIEAAGLDVSTTCMYYTFVSGATFEKYCEILDNGSSYTLKNVIGTSFTGIKTGTLQTLLSNDWDIVILQQGSEHSKDFNLWQPWLNKLIQAIRINNPKNPCIAYHMTWNPWYYSNEVYKGNATYINIGYEQIIDSVKKINSFGIDYIIPTGTAIQNVRFSSLNTVHNLHRDEKHLAFGVARYTAAACIFGTIICDLFDISLYGNSAIHTVTEREIADSSNDYLVDNADVTSENNKKIQELVISALDNMYNVTIIE